MRYHGSMKRAMLKLTLRRETLRVLTKSEIVAAVGGRAGALLNASNGDATCAGAQLVDSAGLGTGCPAMRIVRPGQP